MKSILQSSMGRGKELSVMMGLLVSVWLFSASIMAQLPQREYVIGVDDELDIQVFNQVQPLPNFSTRARVRSDRMITLPWLGDVKAAGLKKSTLTSLLESKEYLGKYLTDPHVTITPTRTSATILVFFSGVINQEQELPRDIRLGQVVRELAPNIQQFDPNFDAMTITSAEGEVFAPDQNLRLQWGDEIVIPSMAPTSTPIPQAQPLPSDETQLIAQFSAEEYQTFQDVMQAYPEVYEQLLPLVQYEDDMISLDLTKLPQEQRDALPPAVLDEFQKYTSPAVEPLQVDFSLVGIRVNLKVEGLLEAFLAFPEPEGGTRIRQFKQGDVIRSGAEEQPDLVLKEIDDVAQQVIIEQGDTRQVIPLAPPLSTVSLAGILTNSRGELEAIFQGLPTAAVGDGPVQRQRYKEGAEIEPGVILAKISKAQELAVLQSQEAVQLLFLRDPSKRSTAQSQETSESPIAPPDPFADAASENVSGVPPVESLLRQQMPPQLQAIDTLSQILYATPLF